MNPSLQHKDGSEIPNYDSAEYGARENWPTPEPVNYEAIKLRSGANNWQIGAHRHSSLYQVFLLNRGEFEVELDGETLHYSAPTILIIPPMTVHGFKYEANSDGHVLSILKPALTNFFPFYQNHSQTFDKPTVLHGEEIASHIDIIERIFFQIIEEFQGLKHGRLQALQSHISYLLIYLMRLMKNQKLSRPSLVNEDEGTINKFKELIELNYKLHKSNEFYAKELGVSTSKLASITNEILGSPPQRVAHERLILEAKRILTYTNKTSSEISYILGFNDPAYFSRFFKKLTAQTPAKFRKASLL